uniref:Endonuclease/exonuclease/phosphatase domain-containing protein n=1 Tax=Angiostrongylus cantonensis TaxID=6313 RepID=A0A0K0CU12_ANGCA
MIRYDVIGLAETRRHRPFNAVYDTGEEMFLGTCDIRGVGGVGVIINTSLSMNIDSFEQLTTRIGRLRLKRCGSTPALTIFVVYAPTSNYDEEEVESLPALTIFVVYVPTSNYDEEEVEKLHGPGEALQRRPCILQGHSFIIGDFNARIGQRRIEKTSTRPKQD